jgi:hypothetical protein
MSSARIRTFRRETATVGSLQYFAFARPRLSARLARSGLMCTQTPGVNAACIRSRPSTFSNEMMNPMQVTVGYEWCSYSSI